MYMIRYKFCIALTNFICKLRILYFVLVNGHFSIERDSYFPYFIF